MTQKSTTLQEKKVIEKVKENETQLKYSTDITEKKKKKTLAQPKEMDPYFKRIPFISAPEFGHKDTAGLEPPARPRGPPGHPSARN